MAKHMLDEWNVDPSSFPYVGSSADKLRFLVRYAILAPSPYNVQPWQFLLEEHRLMLRRDESRSLPVIDPDHRELTVSCGAALYNLRVAARHFGYDTIVHLCPDPADTDLLAVVELADGPEATRLEETEFSAIPRRHTNRREYFDKDIPDAVIAKLRDSIHKEGVWLHVLDEREKRAAARFVWEADRMQEDDPRYRHELGHWLHGNGGPRRDGIPGSAFRFEGFDSFWRPLAVRLFGWGDEKPYEDRQLADDTPLMLALGTDRDDPVARMRAGMALERVLLRASAESLCASWFNQPLQVPALRERVRELLSSHGRPQVLLGLGYGFHCDPIPRLRAEDVTIDLREGPKGRHADPDSVSTEPG